VPAGAAGRPPDTVRLSERLAITTPALEHERNILRAGCAINGLPALVAPLHEFGNAHLERFGFDTRGSEVYENATSICFPFLEGVIEFCPIEGDLALAGATAHDRTTRPDRHGTRAALPSMFAHRVRVEREVGRCAAP